MNLMNETKKFSVDSGSVCLLISLLFVPSLSVYTATYLYFVQNLLISRFDSPPCLLEFAHLLISKLLAYGHFC